jgi:Tol biopolymer transport system component
MKETRSAVVCQASAGFPASASGPQDRVPTGPKSIASPANPQAGPVSVKDLFYSRRLLEPAWSPHAKQLSFTCNLSGRLNLWKMPVEGGWPVQMLQSGDRQLGGVWSRDGRWIVYRQDRGGDEYFDLYAVPSEGGAPASLTNTPDIAELAESFSPDGTLLVIQHKAKTSPSFNLAILDW